MNILVIGSGGREHAFAWKLAQSPKCNIVYIAPGNSGTINEVKVRNINITKIDELIEFAKTNDIAFTVVGPEIPLALGIVDKFRQENLKIWGPTQFCTQLESSKAFAKDFMIKNNIPTAKYKIFDDCLHAIEYLNQQTAPIVIKADGLANGKGVLVAQTINDAIDFVKSIFDNRMFGNAGSKVVIEEFLSGIEASFIVMIDGKNILPMASSQDHKQLLDDDLGPNTGGMGAYSPTPIINNLLHDRIIKEIIQPVIDGMKAQGHVYNGFLYAGLMIDSKGNPKTLEFNCRFGDPETQPILMRLESDLVELFEYGFNIKLDQATVNWYNGYAVGVVLATDGYPSKPRINDLITGLNSVNSSEVKAFYAGVQYKNGNYYTAGGRVLCITAKDTDLKTAQFKVYQSIKKINFAGMQYRNDIANKAFTL